MLHIQAQLRNPLHHQQQILLLEKMRSSYQKNMRFLSLRKFQKGRKSQPLVTHHPGTQLKKVVPRSNDFLWKTIRMTVPSKMHPRLMLLSSQPHHHQLLRMKTLSSVRPLNKQAHRQQLHDVSTSLLFFSIVLLVVIMTVQCTPVCTENL